MAGGGVAAEKAISAGVEIAQRFGHVWTVGAGWAKPSTKTFGPGLDNETVLETSYTFQLSKSFSITPDVQLVLNPANDPGTSSVWVFGLRALLFDVENGARLERKCPAERRARLNHVDFVFDAVFANVAADLQVTVSEPEIIQVT